MDRRRARQRERTRDVFYPPTFSPHPPFLPPPPKQALDNFEKEEGEFCEIVSLIPADPDDMNEGFNPEPERLPPEGREVDVPRIPGLEYSRESDLPTSSRGSEDTGSNRPSYGSLPNSTTPPPPTQFTLYTRRWFMLVVVCVLNFSNATLWISYAAIANLTDQYYCNGKDACGSADMLSLVFMICSIPMGFFAMWGVDKFGLRTGILVGSWVNCLGALIRVFSNIDGVPEEGRYPLVLTGQVVAALSQPFIMYLPTKLAALWFPQAQRAIANTCGSMSNPLGIMVAMLLAPVIVRRPEELLILNCAMLAPAAVVAFVATLGVWSSTPPTAPTASAANPSPPFFQGLKLALKTRSFWILMLCLGGGVGLFNSIYTLIQQILCPKGYSNSFAGICGALLIVGGLVGSAITGLIADKTKKYVELTKICYLLAATISIAIAIMTLEGERKYTVGALMTAFGMFGFAIYPIGLEMGVEITYPVAEATSSGLIIIMGQIMGVVFLVVMQMAAGKPTEADLDRETCSVGAADVKPQNWKAHQMDVIGPYLMQASIEPKVYEACRFFRIRQTVPNLIWAAAACALAISITAFFWPKYLRLAAEQEDAETQNAKRIQAAQKRESEQTSASTSDSREGVPGVEVRNGANEDVSDQGKYTHL